MKRRRDNAGHSCLHQPLGYGIKNETRLEEIMKKVLVSLLLVSAALLCSCTKQGEQKSSAYIAKVGSEVITQEDVNREFKGLPPQIQNMFAGPDGAEKFADELVKREMLSQEAKKKGFENDAEYKKKVEEFKKLTLISLLLQKEVEEKAKVTDKDVKDYYEAHKAELTTNNQVRASHILVKNEEEANKILEQVRKGADFAKIAKEKSIDTGSAKNGGDLGFFSRGQMVPEFENAAFALKQGEVGGPLKTQFGYHIIKVTGKKEGTVVEFEKVKDLLTQKVTAEKQKQVFDTYLNELKKSYKVEINKDALAKVWKDTKDKTGGVNEKAGQPTAKPESAK